MVDWHQTGQTCDANKNVGGYTCDGTYSCTYYLESRTLSFCYEDMSGSTQTKTETRAGSLASRVQVTGQCNYNPAPTRTIYATLSYGTPQYTPTPFNVTVSLSEAAPGTFDFDIDGCDTNVRIRVNAGSTSGSTTVNSGVCYDPDGTVLTIGSGCSGSGTDSTGPWVLSCSSGGGAVVREEVLPEDLRTNMKTIATPASIAGIIGASLTERAEFALSVGYRIKD